MTLSRASIETISDLIENRLSMMCIGDQDDLRQKMVLQRALAELNNQMAVPAGVLNDFANAPRRGRRRKIAQG
jgi:hypothetical protein